jgi:hypothetical protein
MIPEPFAAPPEYHDLLARLWEALVRTEQKPLPFEA